MSTQFVNVASLMPGQHNCNLKLRVLSVETIAETVHPETGRVIHSAEAIVGDDTACILLNLKNDQVNLLSRNARLQVLNGQVNMYRGFMRLEVNEDEDDTNASMRSLTQERPSIIAIPDEDEEEDTSSNESGTHRSEVTGGSPSMDRSGTENQITPPVTSLGSGSTVPGTGAETGSQRSNEAPIGIQVPQSPTRQGLTSWYTVQSIPWQIPRTSLMTTARTPGHPPSDSFPINTLTSSVSTGSGSSLAVAPSPSSRRNQMEVEMRLGTGGSVPLLEYYRTIEFTYFSTVEPVGR